VETAPLDLDAYLARIDYKGSLQPTVATLQSLQYHHVTHIPFENLTPLCREPVVLDIITLQSKLVASGRGGYCFEHNLLMAAVLRRLGFKVQGLAARVRWHNPDTSNLPRTHMLLKVLVDGEHWLVDVGFGGLTPTAPLPLMTDKAVSTSHETFMLKAEDDLFVLQAKLPSGDKDMYAFDLQPQQDADFEMMNWYVSTYPESRFVTTLVAARADKTCRYALQDGIFSVYPLHGDLEKREIGSVMELKELLIEKFLIDLPQTAELDEVLQHVLDK
jgi:N-hydroxyarylamine O-acetyltransferase